MGTIREYFDTELREMAIHKKWEMRAEDHRHLGDIIAKIAYNFDANAKYWYFFIDEGLDVASSVAVLLNAPETSECKLSSDGDGVEVHSFFSDYSERQVSSTLVFTRRINLYVDADLTPFSREELSKRAAQEGFFISIKDREYARKRTEVEKPLAFISHDFRDKEALVRELALEMSKLMCQCGMMSTRCR